jgi:guanylate kinase
VSASYGQDLPRFNAAEFLVDRYCRNVAADAGVELLRGGFTEGCGKRKTVNSSSNGRLVILTGPSCAGKSPLAKALWKFHPDLASRLQPLVLYNSRDPRPGERNGIDYHFRTRSQIEALRDDDRYALLDVRGDLQALDLEEVQSLLKSGNSFFEGNPFVGKTLLMHRRLANISKLSVFLSPLSKEEILYLKVAERNDLRELVTDVMRRKLLRRTRRQKGELSGKDLENIERRAGSAYSELQEAWHFDHVIPNHDGEDSDNWEAFYYPLGEARNSLNAFVALLQGKIPEGIEKWDAQLFPSAG